MHTDVSVPRARPRPPRLRRRAIALVVAATSLLLGLQARPAAAAPLPVWYSSLSAAGVLLAPNVVAGANDWGCRPSAAHPQPVVLVHGTFGNMGEFSALSPLLKNNGYCVFALNYGATAATALTANRVYGVGKVDAAAGELGAFVDRVLAATGASKVDLVGHSQGGMMPNYYVKFLGGAPKVRTIVGLAPDNHGSTLSGVVNLQNELDKVFPGLARLVTTVLGAAGAPALADQEAGSPFITKLNSLPDTVPGVRYTVISSKHDQIATPVSSQKLIGPNATNILLQDRCGLDFVDHVAIVFDHLALRHVLNALDPAHAVTPTCGLVLPYLGG